MHPALIPTHLTTPRTDPIVVTIGGRPVTSLVRFDSMVATDAGTNTRGVTDLDLEAALASLPEVRDQAPLRVYSYAGDFNMALGYVQSRRPVVRPKYTAVSVRAIDAGSLLDDIYIPSEPRPAERLRARIGYLWGKYATEHLSRDMTKVQPIGGVLPAQDYAHVTLRQAIEQSITQASAAAEYYIEPLAQARLHVFTSENNPAPYTVGGAGFHDLGIEYESQTYANRVYVHGGSTAGSGFLTDWAAVARANGLIRSARIEAPECETRAMAVALANMYLGRVRNATPRGSFTTTSPKDGWRSGQLASVVDTNIGTASVTVELLDTTVVSGGGTPDWHARAAIKRRGDGVLVLVYYRSSNHSANDGALHIRFSADDGDSWTDEDTTLAGATVSGFPMNPSGAGAGEDAGEPWLYLADNGDLILHMWRVDYGVSNGGTYQSVSTDGGESWSASALVDFGGIAGDTNIFATDDDFVLGGVIYAGARVFTDATLSESHAILIKSTDDGASWSYVSDITAAGSRTHEVGLEYLGNNTIIAVIRSLENEVTYQRYSTDLGLTWGTLTDVSTTIGVSGRHRIYTRAHLKGEANWWTDPVLIMVGFQLMAPGNSHPRRNALWVSLDAGATWDGPHYLDDTTNDAGYGDIFYDATRDQYRVVNYQGATTAADLKQYDVSLQVNGEPFRIRRVTKRILVGGAAPKIRYEVEMGGAKAA